MNLDNLLNDAIKNLFGINPSLSVKKVNPKNLLNTSINEHGEGTSSFGSKVLSKARSDIGVHEDLGKNDGKRIREYFKYFKMGGGQDWCAAAVSAWLIEAGGGPISGAVGARNVGAQFAQAGRWVARDKISANHMIPGNIVVWSRGGPDSWKGHIGVIESFDGRNSFTSIEGNSGPRSDAVVVNTHSIKDANLLGVGILSDYVPSFSKKSFDKIDKMANIYYQKAFKLINF